MDECFKYYMIYHYHVGHILLLTKTIKNSEVKFSLCLIIPRKGYTTLLYIVFRMAQSEPSSGVKGKAIYNKNLSN